MKPSMTYGIDLDRVGAAESALSRVRRRWSGRYPVDPFGADPMLQDAIHPAWPVTVEVRGPGTLPEIGPAVLVTHQRAALSDALVVRAAVRDVRHRRARVVGYPDVPGLGGWARRMGSVRRRGEDLASVLRAGHIAVVSLSPTVRSHRAGHAPAPVLWGAVGFPVMPVVVRGGFLGLPVGHHRITLGAPLQIEGIPRDPLSAAELATAARDAVQDLLDRT